MFKCHKFQNLQNSVTTQESISQRLGIKRHGDCHRVQLFCFIYGETEALGGSRAQIGNGGIGKLFLSFTPVRRLERAPGGLRFPSVQAWLVGSKALKL